MRVLSLFDGMSCGILAMISAGVQVDEYIAYEIDKYAVQASSHNFPQIKHMGDVFQADFTQHQNMDFLVGGSPCTYWSIAQSKNRETTASGLGWELFSQYVRALKEAKPKYFIYENNKSMSKAIRDSIRETFGFEEICINSALVSAQNRQRYYWVGKRNDDGTYSKVNVKQPDDRGILLKDVLDGAYAFQDKAYTYTTRCQAASIENTLKRHQHTMVAEPCGTTRDGKSYCLVSNYHKGFGENLIEYNNHHQQRSAVAEPVRIGCFPSPDGTVKNSQGMRIYSSDGKAVTQSAQGGGMGAKTGLYAIPLAVDLQVEGRKKNEDGTYHRQFESKENGKSSALTSVESRRMVAVPVNITADGKSQCLRSTCYKDGIRNIAGNDVDKKTGVAEAVCIAQRGRYENQDKTATQHFEPRTDGKTNTLTTVEKDNMVAEPCCMRFQRTDEAKKVRKQYEAGEIHHGFHELSEMHPRPDGKTNTLSTVLKDNPVAEPVWTPYAIPVAWDEDGKPVKAMSGADGKVYTVYAVKDGQITIKDKTYPIKLSDGFWIIRKLTVSECKRLQTVPDWYDFSCVSNTQAYKMLGNGWTVEVIAHLIKACLKGNVCKPKEIQLSIFD